MFNFPKISNEAEELLLSLYDSSKEHSNTFFSGNQPFINEMVSLGLISFQKDSKTYSFTQLGLDFIIILKNKNRRTSILKKMTLEDYLLAIDYLTKNTNDQNKTNDIVVPMSDLARYLGLSNSSISEYVRIIEKEGFLVIIPRKGVKLTANGKGMVLSLMEQRELLVTFFHSVLQLDSELAEV